MNLGFVPGKGRNISLQLLLLFSFVFCVSFFFPITRDHFVTDLWAVTFACKYEGESVNRTQMEVKQL
jgi:hypothetical protein